MIENPEPAKRPTFAATFAAIFKGQLSRAKTAAIPIFLAATLQSVGLVVLLKGLVDTAATSPSNRSWQAHRSPSCRSSHSTCWRSGSVH